MSVEQSGRRLGCVDDRTIWAVVNAASRRAVVVARRGGGSRVERRWKVLAVTSVAVYIALLDVTIVNIASPSMLRSFVHDSLVSLSWVLNAYNIVFAAALVPAGRLADRLGRRRVFLTGLMIFLVASLACSLAPTVPFLVAARALQAVGVAVVVPTSLGLILPLFPVAQRATAT